MRLNVLSADRAPRPPGGLRELAHELASQIEGEVRFDQTSRSIYSTDASNYRHIPHGVVVPRSNDDVEAVVKVCGRHGVPLTGRGGGTSLAGQCCNTAVIIDFSKYMHQILEIDPDARTARVQPGVTLDVLRNRAQREHGLTFGPDPSTHAYCTLGGMIGNNSCGVHSVMCGADRARTSDWVSRLHVVTADGTRMDVGGTTESELGRLAAGEGRTAEIYRGIRDVRSRYGPAVRQGFPKIPRRVSGYNLDDLLPEKGCHVARSLAGSEGTLALMLEATVELIHHPPRRSLLILGYNTIREAADEVPFILQLKPIGLEGFDAELVRFMKRKGLHEGELELLPEGNGWLLVEFGGETGAEADDRARAARDAIGRRTTRPHIELVARREREEKIWEVRESGLGATAFVPGLPDTWAGFEDAAVHPDQLGPYLSEFKKLLDRYQYNASTYGHFGQGLVHCRIPFDLVTPHGISKYRAFIDEAADLVVAHGGSISGEHGDGQARARLLQKMYGPEIMEGFHEFKRVWDPANRMNPGKVIDAPDPTKDLRLGGDYRPAPRHTRYAFSDDDGAFHRASMRCVGVGLCRRREGVFMCPTYRVTGEEAHTTRGRARALFEMARGDFDHGGWRSRAVHETLDLCIGCKGCKKQCPVHVDMALYKSEFLSHYFAGRPRPRAHYSMGLIDIWARLAEVAPGVANLVGQGRLTAPVAKWTAGVSQRRELPSFAPQTFRSWWGTRRSGNEGGQPLVLLPDLFNDVFYPRTLRAAACALERLGFRVIVPRARIPDARPALHYGLLGRARRLVKRAIAELRPWLSEDIPIVCLEPSSVAVFRDELSQLLPQDVDAVRAKDSVKLLSEFLCGAGRPLPRLDAVAVFHAHCHQKAVLDADAGRRVLESMKISFEEPEPGCCGMAGSFGFEAEHENISTRIGEMNLLPKVRDASEDAIIIADGFSCRTQISQRAGRRALHTAEVLAMALGIDEEVGG